MIYKLYGITHKTAKRILQGERGFNKNIKMINFDDSDFDESGQYHFESETALFVNDYKYEAGTVRILKDQVYPVENLVPIGFKRNATVSFQRKTAATKFAHSMEDAAAAWETFILAAQIPDGYRNAGCYYGGFIKECLQWCLPSWIWTNAALVRYFCVYDMLDKAKKLGDRLIAMQQPCGGWIVRNDYSQDGVIPELAPNDSCYIALNCCLSLYDVTGEKKYLDAAEKNAEWVMETAREDGMVYFGFDMKNERWITEKNIVDTGFTAGFFARLYELTEKEMYLVFLRRFVKAYVKAFYMPKQHCFATGIDGEDRQRGGAFGRGQGWALEGLIPAYRVLRDEKIKKVIEETITTLLDMQLKNGGWSYNLLRPLMGVDCKGVPVIAKCLLEWYEIGKQDDILLQSARKALEWCVRHTATSGRQSGGIFSYTTEGAIVHHMYTNTALVYSSAYAAEVKRILDEKSHQ